ncbi:hypothetical protein WCT84_19510 [Pectobacterium brasiliense]|uniref:hypothetical protein n=1 Tax=Pectobacterium brasiliense TaxID=180957 RepID=UPI0030195BB2
MTPKTNNIKPNWFTIKEAVKLFNQSMNDKITESDIYRGALCGNISLSIYFQSSIRLLRVKTHNDKIKIKPTDPSLINRVCFLDSTCFIRGRNLIASTEGEFIFATTCVLETPLLGHEYKLIQQLLAKSLNISMPKNKSEYTNYGISVTISGVIYQLFERTTWIERLEQQTIRLPKSIAQKINEAAPSIHLTKYCNKEHFPIHNLPQDACFVILQTELERIINIRLKNDTIPLSSTRITTPLSRFLWLSCKNNESISPLIKQPYKLLSIFEQWASVEGITDRLSGDTLKTALERGSPSSISTSK